MTDHELLWLPIHGKVPDRERVTIQSRKVMLTIVCGPTGFAVVTAIKTGCKFNAGYYVSNVPTPLSEWWCERGSDDFRKLIAHVDRLQLHKVSVSQQFMAQNAMVIAAHPLFSPDLASSDFYVFGHVKGLLRASHSRLGSDGYGRSRVL
jgi:hypothetical protein